MSTTAASWAAYVGRLTWGAALLVAPGTVLTTARADNDQTARTILRVLGARHVLQSVIVGRQPGRVRAGWAVAVDLTHAATAVGLAVADPRRRRAATTDAAVAITWACLSTYLRHHS